MTGFKILLGSVVTVMTFWAIVLIPYRTTQYQPQPKAYYQTEIKPIGLDCFFNSNLKTEI